MRDMRSTDRTGSALARTGSMGELAMKSKMSCPVCASGLSSHYADIDGFPYLECQACGSLHISTEVLASLDSGEAPLGRYADVYWQQERDAAFARANGVSLCRAGEAILYCRRPVTRFLDIGTGPGFLVEKLQELLDSQAEIFHGVEKYPPTYASKCRNLHIGEVGDLAGCFDAGACIEVIEHLTPAMLEKLIAGLAAISSPGSFWLFNTGMPDYVKKEDPAYLDPLKRGHIVSYSLAGLDRIFSRHGFAVRQLPGKSFAFCAEFLPAEPVDFDARIYRPLKENLSLLQRNHLLYQAAFESARSYFYQAGYFERTAWALSLAEQLKTSSVEQQR